jgi:cobalt/nickel transport protein
MTDRTDSVAGDVTDTHFFDGFTRTMLAVMFMLLLFIFVSGKYMSAHRMEAGGTDDKVNNLATEVSRGEHHPFIELPGDAQVGAFSIANFFAGLIVGHHWSRLFGSRRRRDGRNET